MENWKRNLFILWLALFFAAAGLSAVVPFLPLFIRELGVTNLAETSKWSGYVFSAPFIVSFFVIPLWGSLGDRYGQKLMTLRAILGLSVALLLMAFSQNVVHLFIFRMLQGALSGFYPAALALAVSTAPKERTGFALGVIESASTSGNVIGPLFGGVLSQLFGFRNVFIIVGVLVFISGLLIFFYLKEDKESKNENENRYSVVDNWKFVFSSKQILLAGMLIALSSFAISSLTPIFVLYVETFKVKASSVPLVTGLLYSILGLFAAISSLIFGRRIDEKGLKKNLLLSASVMGIMYFLHFFIYQIFYLIPVRILLGLGYGLIIPILFTALSKRVVMQRKAGIMGIGSSFQILGSMIGPISSGYIAAMFGVRYSFILAGIIFTLITVITLKYVKE
ncbi:MAG: MFS transporter [Ignavibacteriaceae bacterium]|jgi:DHA1 family multidrug resistance protein-like MFS transporter